MGHDDGQARHDGGGVAGLPTAQNPSLRCGLTGSFIHLLEAMGLIPALGLWNKKTGGDRALPLRGTSSPKYLPMKAVPAFRPKHPTHFNPLEVWDKDPAYEAPPGPFYIALQLPDTQ